MLAGPVIVRAYSARLNPTDDMPPIMQVSRTTIAMVRPAKVSAIRATPEALSSSAVAPDAAASMPSPVDSDKASSSEAGTTSTTSNPVAAADAQVSSRPVLVNGRLSRPGYVGTTSASTYVPTPGNKTRSADLPTNNITTWKYGKTRDNGFVPWFLALFFVPALMLVALPFLPK